MWKEYGPSFRVKVVELVKTITNLHRVGAGEETIIPIAAVLCGNCVGRGGSGRKRRLWTGGKVGRGFGDFDSTSSISGSGWVFLW